MKRLYTDKEEEYIILELQSFLREQEIIHETSTPYVYQQYSCAKWLNCILLKKAQSIWLEVYLPDFWWKFAIVTIAYVYNYIFIRYFK